MRVVALIAILGLNPRKTRATGGHSCTNLANPLSHSFAVEGLVCPRCAGPRRIVGPVTELHAVRRLLAALGLAAEPPPGIPLGTRS